MNTIDLIIFIAYCLLILSVGLFVSRGKKGDERDAGDYFLAGRRLAWWAIGASIIASNISAEQFVGMSGSGYAIGLAAFAGIYSIYGGLKAVALTDVVQVVFLLAAGWSRPISPSTSSEKATACTREWSTSMARRAISST